MRSHGLKELLGGFLPEREDFYRKCGFFLLNGGVIDNAAPK